MPQNYMVARGSFGAYPKGSILPEFAVKQAGGLEEYLAKGKLVPTNAAVNVELSKPRVQTSVDVGPEVIEEQNRLRSENSQLVADNRKMVAVTAHADQRVADLKSEIVRYVEENSRLRRMAEEHDKEKATMSADYNRLGDELKATQKELEAATATIENMKKAEATAKSAKKAAPTG